VAVQQIMLFHVSEEPGTERFEPRAPAGAGDPVVWAIDAERLRNYLVPRECPHVTYLCWKQYDQHRHRAVSRIEHGGHCDRTRAAGAPPVLPVVRLRPAGRDIPVH
jgi:hypothetical protein